VRPVRVPNVTQRLCLTPRYTPSPLETEVIIDSRDNQSPARKSVEAIHVECALAKNVSHFSLIKDNLQPRMQLLTLFCTAREVEVVVSHPPPPHE
jgi:hypothetical protein